MVPIPISYCFILRGILPVVVEEVDAGSAVLTGPRHALIALPLTELSLEARDAVTAVATGQTHTRRVILTLILHALVRQALAVVAMPTRLAQTREGVDIVYTESPAQARFCSVNCYTVIYVGLTGLPYKQQWGNIEQ